ncbi:MAG: choice-of-anchor Q domain-containing protein [Rudaea sp.]
MKFSNSLVLVLLLALQIVWPATARAAVGTVTVTNATDSNSTTLCTLRDAIRLIDGITPIGSCTLSGMQSPPEIHFSMTLPATITLTSPLVPTSSMNIVGPGQTQLTLSGNDTVRVFGDLTTGGNTLSISNLSIAHGKAPSGFAGGGISFCCGQVVVLDSVNLHDNQSDFAGGAIDAVSDLTLTNSIVENNRAVNLSDYFLSFGGGIYAESGNITIDHSIIRGNTVGATSSGSDPGMGGGILVNGSTTVVMTDSTVSGNHALGFALRSGFNPDGSGLGGQGGGVFVDGGTWISRGNTISGNNATFEGGGVFNIGAADIINSTIAQNTVPAASSPSRGAGIYDAAANGFGSGVVLYLSNATVYANSAGSGGGLYNAHAAPADVVIANSAFGNRGSGETGGDIVNATGAALTGNFDLVENASSAGGLVDGSAGNIVGHAARFGTFASHGGATFTVGFASASPLFDHGSNALALDENNKALAHDQRDDPAIPRIMHGTVDIGALETDVIFSDGFQ